MAELNGKMQVIVVNHAKWDNADFTAEIVGDWKYTGLKLVSPE